MRLKNVSLKSEHVRIFSKRKIYCNCMESVPWIISVTFSDLKTKTDNKTFVTLPGLLSSLPRANTKSEIYSTFRQTLSECVKLESDLYGGIAKIRKVA